MDRVITLFPKQKAAFIFNTQFGAAVAGVQSGKTLLGVCWTIKNIQSFPDKNGIIVAPTYKILHAATLKKLFDIFPELRSRYKEQKGEIELPKGGMIYIRSADNPLGIEGITAHWIWLDEGGMTSQLTWTVLRSRVSMTGGQILITTTPYNMGWLYTDFFVPWKNKIDNQLSFFTWPSVENPYFNKEFFEAERSRLPTEEFARRYEGEFRKMTGLVWDLPESQIIAPIDNLKSKSDTRILGVDWGFRNPAAIIVLYRYDQCWYVVDEWKMAEKVNAEILQVIQNKIKEHHANRIYADSAEPDRIEEGKRARLPMYEANKDVEGGLSFIRQLITEKRLFIYNTCPQYLEEISMYHYNADEQDEKENKELPVKFNDHLMDAKRYAIYSFQEQQMSFGPASPLASPIYGDIDIKF